MEGEELMRDAIPKVAGLLDFTGKTIVVTGASAGIGAGIARRFVEAGASVAINYRSDRSGAEALADSLGGKAIAVHADITDQAAVEALMQAAVDRFGGLDGLINNAALQDHGAFMELPGDRFDQMLQANVGGAFRCAQAAAKHMSTGGAIVNIASISGLEPAFSHAHYCSSKAALIMLTRAAALELGPRNIRVNAVAPGLIWREGLDKNWPEGLARWLAHVPLGRVGQDEDVADACLFFASAASRFVTGATLTVDGGVTAHPSY
jgi:NAD(P)-dependent dehydrogenase (short-subunit alcohol dehydrogenase family)